MIECNPTPLSKSIRLNRTKLWDEDLGEESGYLIIPPDKSAIIYSSTPGWTPARV